MGSRLRVFAVLLAGVLSCAVARAQMGGAGSSARQPSAPAAQHVQTIPAVPARHGAMTSPSGHHGGAMQIPPSGHVPLGFDSTSNAVSFDGVPGLGFDFPHLAAISRAQGGNPSFHFGHNGHHERGSFVPILFGGYPYYGYPYYDDMGSDQPGPQQEMQAGPQPQIIVIQQPVSSQQGASSASAAGNVLAAEPAPPVAAPIPDRGDFIFVRRDGRILFASLFSVVGAQLQYVTREGNRHTIAISDLDADATRDMNEARGTTVQIHN
jgi:hypothetical protein